MACDIEVKDATGGTVVSVAGDADLNSAEALREALDHAAANGGRFAVDLNEATLVDSRMIGVLAHASAGLKGEGRDLPIVCANPNILRLFSTIGLERTFDFFPTVEAAFAD